jgi:hypothetical protein
MPDQDLTSYLPSTKPSTALIFTITCSNNKTDKKLAVTFFSKNNEMCVKHLILGFLVRIRIFTTYLVPLPTSCLFLFRSLE